MKKIFKPLSMLCFFVIAGCQKSNMGIEIPLNTQNFTSFPLDGKSIEFKSKYDSFTMDSYVNSLVASVLDWSKQHFIAQGSQGKAVVEIDEVIAKDTPLTPNKGISSYLTINQAGTLEASLALKISIQDNTGFTKKFLEIKARRSQTYPEKITLAQKEKVWRSVINSIINTLNDKLKQMM